MPPGIGEGAVIGRVGRGRGGVGVGGGALASCSERESERVARRAWARSVP